MATRSIALAPIVFLIAVLLGGFAVAFIYRRRKSAGVTEPSCGQCGYCVRGIATLTCPECGGDLREVGIVTPGSSKPMSTRARLILWTLIVPLPGLMIGAMLTPAIAPWDKATRQTRVIFSHASYLPLTVHVVRHGRMLTIGRQATPPAPFQIIQLELNGQSRSAMRVTLPANQFQYNLGPAGAGSGTFDAAAIEKWFNAQGFNDPRVGERAKDFFDAISEMDTPAGNGFSDFSPDPSRGNLAIIKAHPASTFTVPEANALTAATAIIFTALVWLIGLPFILRRHRSPEPMMSEPLPA